MGDITVPTAPVRAETRRGPAPVPGCARPSRFLPGNVLFAETLVLFLEESNADLRWLYAYNATALVSDQYIREAWK